VITPRVVVVDELGQALFELTRQVLVLKQDLVLHGAVVTLDLALGHRVIGVLRQNVIRVTKLCECDTTPRDARIADSDPARAAFAV